MAGTGERVLAVRRRTLSFARPISVEQGFNTLMRTTDVAALGGAYLAIVWAAPPVRILAIVASRVLGGTGDTRTRMAVRVVGNVVNIAGTVTLGLGVGWLPVLGPIHNSGWSVWRSRRPPPGSSKPAASCSSSSPAGRLSR